MQNLVIKTAGEGYSLLITGLDANYAGFASIKTPTFNIVVGPVFQLSFSTFLGIATGGLSFSPNPGIAISDRGGNRITAVSGGTITAYMKTSPSGNEPLLPANRLIVPIVNGLAIFQGLYINTAGYPYVVGFHATIEVGPLKT